MFPSAAERLNKNQFYTDELNNNLSIKAPEERNDLIIN